MQAAGAEAETPVPGFGVADDDELLSVPAAFDLDAVARHAGCGAGGSFSLALVPCYGESTPLGVHDKAPLLRVGVSGLERVGDEAGNRGADRSGILSCAKRFARVAGRFRCVRSQKPPVESPVHHSTSEPIW